MPEKLPRSGIACEWCRRDKVKCIKMCATLGCTACQRKRRSCYLPGPKSIAATRGETRDNSFPCTNESAQGGSLQTRGDPIDAPGALIITKEMWNKVYDIFKMHFSTEMPFLHLPTLRSQIHPGTFPQDVLVPATSDGRNLELLLLGILTLTARFHPELVAYHTVPLAQQNRPLAASEYYATTLATAFEVFPVYLTNPSPQSIQALLMLGHYEWSQGKDIEAREHVGHAIRLAESMGLEYDLDLPSSQERSKPEADDLEAVIREESRRRTMWSCFIMDRMLADGENRPMMIRVEKLRVRLPCCDDQFLFARKVQTGEGVLGRYICLVEIFGRLCNWRYAGDRTTEKLPPGDKFAEFLRLRQHLEDFHKALPLDLMLVRPNLSAHMEKHNATTYVSMYVLHSLCLIMLHSEYMQPLCQKPEPPFPMGQFETPVGFWEQSVETMFEAARTVIHVIRVCWDNNRLPETPLIGFALWEAVCLCVYAAHFPHTDTGRHLLGLYQMNQSSGDFWSGVYTNPTVAILSRITSSSKMADGYVSKIREMHAYFEGVKGQYKLVESGLRECGEISPNGDTALTLSDHMDPVQNFQVNQCPNPGLPDHRNDSPVVFFHANTYGDVSEGCHANPIATNNGPSEVGMQKWTNGKQNHSYLADNRIDPGFDQAGNLFMDAWDGLSSLG